MDAIDLNNYSLVRVVFRFLASLKCYLRMLIFFSLELA
jgi:hypothetical protein